MSIGYEVAIYVALAIVGPVSFAIALAYITRDRRPDKGAKRAKAGGKG